MVYVVHNPVDVLVEVENDRFRDIWTDFESAGIKMNSPFATELREYVVKEVTAEQVRVSSRFVDWLFNRKSKTTYRVRVAFHKKEIDMHEAVVKLSNCEHLEL